jgi:hypothetical protein
MCPAKAIYKLPFKDLFDSMEAGEPVPSEMSGMMRISQRNGIIKGPNCELNGMRFLCH